MKTLMIALSLLALTATSAFASPGVRADEEPLPDGELHVTLKNAEYVKVQVNGNDHELVEFEKDGKVALIKGLSLSLERNAVTLIPNDAAMKPVELDVLPKEFKKVRKGKVVILVAKRNAAFEKAPPTEPTPEPKPIPVAPEPEKEDDL